MPCILNYLRNKFLNNFTYFLFSYEIPYCRRNPNIMTCRVNNSQYTDYVPLAICSALSLLGSLFIFCTFLALPSLRSYSYRIIFYISIADILRSLLFIIPSLYDPSPVFCDIYAVILHSGGLMPIFLSFIIAFDIFNVSVRANLNYEKHHTRLLLVNYIVIPIVYVLPIFTNSYGKVAYICTFTNDFDGNLWRFGLFLMPCWIFIFTIIVLYAVIYFKVRNIHLSKETQEMLNRFMLYPLVLALLLIPLTFARIIDLFVSDCVNLHFSTAAQCVYVLHGFCNFAIYGLSPNIKSLIRKRITGMKTRMKKKTLVNSSTDSEVVFSPNHIEEE
jgi:hypothetical protein